MNIPATKNIILIRGLTRESAHWGDFVPQLQATFPQTRLTQVDLPGAGPYCRQTSPKTVNGIMENIRSQARGLGAFSPPAVLVAVSLGGMVAWEWLLTYPEEIAGAVLINISLGGLNPFYQRLDWRCYGRLFAAVGKRQIEKREPALLKLLSNGRDNYEKTTKDWISIQKAHPVSGKNALRQLFAAATYQPGDKKPVQPILLINSKGDRLVSPSCSEAIKEKWNLELHTHPWGGHDLTLDDSQWVVAEIKNWLRT